jgi:transcriptional regulator with XRE-family HTH domain
MNTNDFSRQLGSKLRIARLNCGLSLAQVEERSGGRWTKDSLGGYESGRRRIKAETFAELAGFYGVCNDALLPSTDMPLPY